MSEEESKPAQVQAGAMNRFLTAQKREARHVLTELLAVRGLMPLLMKSRNGEQWTPAEKSELIAQLRRLSRLSPYLLFLLVPGSALLLPAYAWWLDRRRESRPNQQPAQSGSAPESLRP
jgi:hypothetical protein